MNSDHQYLAIQPQPLSERHIGTTLSSTEDWDTWDVDVRSMANAYGIVPFVIEKDFTSVEKPKLELPHLLPSGNPIQIIAHGTVFTYDGYIQRQRQSYEKALKQHMATHIVHDELLSIMKSSLKPDLARFVTDISDCHTLYHFLRIRFAPPPGWYRTRLARDFSRLRAEAHNNRMNTNPTTREAWLEYWWLLHSEAKRFGVLDRRMKRDVSVLIRRFYWDFRGQVDGGMDKRNLEEFVQSFDIAMYGTLMFCRLDKVVQSGRQHLNSANNISQSQGLSPWGLTRSSSSYNSAPVDRNESRQTKRKRDD